MSKSIQLETKPPVTVKIWKSNRQHFWQYDYEGCPKYGPFTDYQHALADSLFYSTK